jgi:MerR-like DNA binding protein
MRISELADRVGVPTSTVRYYERIGLIGAPSRTGSGYRAYDEESATRLLFWDGTNCAAAGERVGRLIDDKQAEIASRITQLQWFAAQLDDARTALAASASPDACCTDLSCCVPAGPTESVPLDLISSSQRRQRASIP